MNSTIPDAEVQTMVLPRVADDYPAKHRVDEKPMAGITVDVIVAAAFRSLDRRSGYTTHSRSAQ